ncbi:MAG: protein kinase [Polyangiaceae bacterium]|nr:protein kinase [Polyangiaceae bacterium]
MAPSTNDPTIRKAAAPVAKPDEGFTTVAPSPLCVGYEVAGRYRVERLLGEGGMGRVWLAFDLEEQRQVALKELYHQGGRAADADESVLVLRREFFAMRRLEHPGTVKVYDCGVIEGAHRYLVMEMVWGQRLDHEAGARPLGPARIYDVLIGLAEVLAFIHARSFVHCDVKASNVMVGADGALKLLDFGVMHPLGARADGALHGTPSYMAPEWLREEPIDGRADLYSLGALAYYLAAGRLPFEGRTGVSLFHAHLRLEPPPPSRFAPVDPALERIVLRLLAKRSADRHQDAGELLADLAVAAGRPPPAAPLAARASYLRVPKAVGRDDEMAELGVRLDGAVEGRSRALFLAAPAGVGKSHLLQEFELRVRALEVPFAVGQCRAEGMAPLAPVEQALRALAPATPPRLFGRHRGALIRLLGGEAAPDRSQAGTSATVPRRDRAEAPASTRGRRDSSPPASTRGRRDSSPPASTRGRRDSSPPASTRVRDGDNLPPASGRDPSEGPVSSRAGAEGSDLEAQIAWVQALAAECPFVLAFEDLHWADAATLERLNLFVRALDGTHGLIVGAFRPDEVDRTSPLHQTFDEGLSDRVGLKPLGAEGLRELVGSALGGLEVPPQLIERLHEVTNGNAFFAIECLRLLIERDVLRLVAGHWQAPGDQWSWPLPASIEDVVRARASALPPELLTFVRRLAPAGKTLELALVRAIGGLPEAALFEALDEGLRRQFLTYSRGRYFFTHDTLQRVLYDDTPAPERAASHLRIAEALEAAGGGDDAARMVGYHFARSSEPARAIAPLVRAGHQARRVNAMLEATLALAEAAELLEIHASYPGRERLLPALWGELIEFGYTGDPPTCVRYARRLLGTWDDAGLTARGRREAFAALAELSAEGGTPAQRGSRLAAFYRGGLAGEGLGPREVYVKIEEYRMYQCVALGVLGQTRAAAGLLARIEAEQPPESPYRAASATTLGVMSVHTGRSGPLLAAQRAGVERLLSLPRRAGELSRSLAWGLGITTYVYNVMLAQRGEPLDDEARAAGTEVGARYVLPDIALYHALTELGRAAFTGDGPAFRRLSAEIADRAFRLGSPRLPERNAVVFSAPYYLERGELDAAEELAATAERLAKRLPSDRWLGLYVLLYRACVETLRGDLEHTASLAQEAARAAGFRHLTILLAYESRAWLARGERGLARQRAEAALARALDPNFANPFDEIVSRRALAAALDGPAALDHLARAAHLAAATDNVLQDGLVHLAIAEAWAPRDRARAQASLAHAEARLGAAGASVWLKQAAALRPTLG